MPVRAFVETTATASSMPWQPLHVHQADSDVGLLAVVDGDRACRIEGTLDRVMANVSAVPFTLFAFTATTAATISQPLEAIRLVVASGSGAGTVNLRALQRGV